VSVEAIRVYFAADVLVDVDDYERSTVLGEGWDLKLLAQAVQDDLGHAGVTVHEVTTWSAP
jgi:hypothetical protein